MKNLSLLTILLLACLGSCQDKNEVADTLLAEVGGAKLYQSEIDGLVPENSLPDDSTSIANAYLERWLKRNVVLAEATKKVSMDLDIEQLVADYKSSLILHNYRESLVARSLDTAVTSQQFTKYYEENKDQFGLSEPIFLVQEFRFPKETKVSTFKRKLTANDTSYIRKFYNDNGKLSVFPSEKWVPLTKLEASLGNKEVDWGKTKANSTLENTLNDRTFVYFVKDRKGIDDTPPITYFENRIRSMIINKRKVELLENKERDIYKRALESNKIKVYTK